MYQDHLLCPSLHPCGDGGFSRGGEDGGWGDEGENSEDGGG